MRKPKFLGVHSSGRGQKLAGVARGAGSLHFIWRLPQDGYAAVELDGAMMPRGRPKAVSEEDYKKNYRLEPAILAAPVTTPDFRNLQPAKKAVSSSGAAELTDEVLGALEKKRKLKQVETDLRNNFNKALRALNRPRDRKSALTALEQLANAREGIAPEHRHMFRDFGVSLRKKSLPDLAVVCARRALELSPNDDHAHFNMARLLGILGYYDEAQAHLKEAMRIDSSESVYGRLQRHLQIERALKDEK